MLQYRQHLVAASAEVLEKREIAQFSKNVPNATII
jgi:hypothetical protein